MGGETVGICWPTQFPLSCSRSNGGSTVSVRVFELFGVFV